MEATDIKKILSGGSSNTQPNASLGGEISATAIVDNVLQNLFDNVSPAERALGATDYRCFYYRNDHPSETLQDAVIFIASQTSSPGTEIAIGLDPAGIGDGVSTGVAATVPDETYPPDGVSFSSPGDAGTGLTIGNLEPDEAFAVWVRRVVTPGTAAASNDPFTLRVTGTPL